MIIVRAPLRITLGGGGTDVPWYTNQHIGFCITAAINKYIYISVHNTFSQELTLHYSEHEKCKVLSDITHPIIRAILTDYYQDIAGLEISSMADIPSGTGLGSSSSFTAALLQAVHVKLHEPLSRDNLAATASRIEMGILREPIGPQDHYATAFGGIRSLNIRGTTVACASVPISANVATDLEENLVLFFTGYSRSASKLLQSQSQRTDSALISNLDATRELGYRVYDALTNGDVLKFAYMLDKQWILKKDRQPESVPEDIERWYIAGKRAGALGGKLIGAGGGGFLMFYSRDKQRLRQTMKAEGLQELRFRFDWDGVRPVMNS